MRGLSISLFWNEIGEHTLTFNDPVGLNNITNGYSIDHKLWMTFAGEIYAENEKYVNPCQDSAPPPPPPSRV